MSFASQSFDPAQARPNVFKIQTLNNISRNGLDRLPANLYSVANEVAAPDAVLVRSADMAEGLRRLGIAVEETPDGAAIEGGCVLGGEVDSRGDHRIAMSFAVAGAVAQGPVRIEDCANVATSFPGFVDLVRDVGLVLVER